jgi:hypothetical protein
MRSIKRKELRSFSPGKRGNSPGNEKKAGSETQRRMKVKLF